MSNQASNVQNKIMFSQYAYYDGKRFDFSVTQAALDNAPRWSATQANPPLAARDALNIATRYLAEFVEQPKRWTLSNLILRPVVGDGYWVYVADFAGFHPPHIVDGAVPTMTLVVLMNGQPVRPTIARYP